MTERYRLEAIDAHRIKKYLDVWTRHGDGPLGAAVRLEDEFTHGDSTASAPR